MEEIEPQMEAKQSPFLLVKFLKALARTLARETKLAKKIVSCIPGFEKSHKFIHYHNQYNGNGDWAKNHQDWQMRKQ